MRPNETPATAVTVALFDSPEYPGLKLFSCTRLRADISLRTCAHNYDGARCNACVDCPIGAHQASARKSVQLRLETAKAESLIHRDNLARRAALRESNGKAATLPCVRCGHTAATKKRLVGRMRLVRGHTICVSCYNREREVLVGSNAKGARPKKWSHLRPASIELERGRDRWAVNIGLCSGSAEARRLAQRCWPGWKMIAFRFYEQLLPALSERRLNEIPMIMKLASPPNDRS